MDYRRAYRLSNIVSISGVLFLLLVCAFDAINALSIVFIIIALITVAIGVVIKVVYYKCPHCNSQLPLRMSTPDYCPSCGKRLES